MFLLQNLHLFVVPGSFFFLAAVFYHSGLVLHERQDDAQKVPLTSDRFKIKRLEG